LPKVVAFADAHSEAGIIGCRVLNPDRTLQPSCFMFPSLLNMLLSATYLYKIFPRSRFFGRERMTWWNRDDVRRVDVITGCFMLIRREALDQIGLLDERFFMYGEETDLCYRTKAMGWSLLFTPAAQIVHYGGQSTGRIRAAMAVQVRVSILQFMRKHHGWFSYRIACLLVIASVSLRLPVWGFLAILSRTRRSESLLTAKAYTMCVTRTMSCLFRP
jgi:GT2 family glycosyltransferase